MTRRRTQILSSVLVFALFPNISLGQGHQRAEQEGSSVVLAQGGTGTKTCYFGECLEEEGFSVDRKTYLMDNLDSRRVIVSQQPDGFYLIEEPGSPWPWSGTAIIEGNTLRGEAKFRDALTRMRVEGEIRNDGSMVIEYIFTRGSDGKPSNRVDRHIWYPTNY